MGFNLGVGGNKNGLSDYMRELSAAGIPLFLTSVNEIGPILEAQDLARRYDVEHTLVYANFPEPEYQVPEYRLRPEEAALNHWELHKDDLPPELDPELVWVQTINEPASTESEWMAEFALETAKLMMADGYRWAAFAWAAGGPDIEVWQTPAMLDFLRLAADNPEKLAIALHEYSFTIDDVQNFYPDLIGRFQYLFQVADKNDIPRPTVLITEWGWTISEIPKGGRAEDDISWAADLYARFPEVKGAAIWTLSSGWGDIDNQVQSLVAPLTEFTLGCYFDDPPEVAELPVPLEERLPVNCGAAN